LESNSKFVKNFPFPGCDCWRFLIVVTFHAKIWLLLYS
jgi:hypothetical protein